MDAEISTESTIEIPESDEQIEKVEEDRLDNLEDSVEDGNIHKIICIVKSA